MNGAAFPEREFPRRCPMGCGFVADPGYPWDEKLAPLAYCPRCAVPLERVACQACGAPPVTQVGYTVYGSQIASIAPNCGHCGEPITRREPRLREKPPVPMTTSVDFGVDNVLASAFGNVAAAQRYEQQAAQRDRVLADRRRACAFQKADPACRCPACKTLRRHLRKKGRSDAHA